MIDSTMIMKDDCIYWFDDGELTENEIDSYTGFSVCALKARWQVVDKYIGNEEVYVAI